MIIMYLIIFLVLWSIVSVAYFIFNLGNKFGIEPWYCWVFFPPMILIATLVGIYYRKRNFNIIEVK